MNKKQRDIIKIISNEVKQRLEGKESGHDWWHVMRVWNVAKRIGRSEGTDMFVVELAALLHDIADWKFHNGDDGIGPRISRQILKQHSVAPKEIDQVCDIVANISFKGAGLKTKIRTLEGKVVQDADRLDAMGALGVARAFSYGGYKNRPMYDPNKKLSLRQSTKTYFQDRGSTVNHFYEKLLLLKNRMHTKTTKKLARNRHRFMENYLKQFFKEWSGKV